MFEILAGRFRVLLDPMGHRAKVVRDIVLTRVVTHQGGTAKVPTLRDEDPAIVNEPVVCGTFEDCRRQSNRETYSRITQCTGSGEDLNIRHAKNTPWGKK